jgi:hypothetical protein
MEAPFPVVPVRGADVEKAWNDLRTRPGHVPVLFGDRECADRVIAAAGFNHRPVDEIIEAGLRLDRRRWIEERIAEAPKYFKFDMTRSGEARASRGFIPALDPLTSKPYDEVFFGLIPVEQPWAVPAYLKQGGWNECPDATVHVAFFRHWFETYGAVPISMAGDVIEFHVARPPATMAQADELAREQFVYCADIVYQSVGTVGNLASARLNGANWYFWWD